eukprot:TRINITY_DN3548_c0_g1_i1.p1 TRINITY_DN3548_c0_g1~~TRINITY_DN3548_c0_g1_i1.p1  ORF type:complete len:482 (-),score=83.26 TRINITY_DN3548_c0_g1_i1:208-1653(-)
MCIRDRYDIALCGRCMATEKQHVKEHIDLFVESEPFLVELQRELQGNAHPNTNKNAFDFRQIAETLRPGARLPSDEAEKDQFIDALFNDKMKISLQLVEEYSNEINRTLKDFAAHLLYVIEQERNTVSELKREAESTKGSTNKQVPSGTIESAELRKLMTEPRGDNSSVNPHNKPKDLQLIIGPTIDLKIGIEEELTRNLQETKNAINRLKLFASNPKGGLPKVESQKANINNHFVMAQPQKVASLAAAAQKKHNTDQAHDDKKPTRDLSLNGVEDLQKQLKSLGPDDAGNYRSFSFKNDPFVENKNMIKEFHVLPYFANLETLNLSVINQKFEDIHFEECFNVLSSLKKLREIRLFLLGNRLTDNGLQILMCTLMELPNLQSITLSLGSFYFDLGNLGNYITDDGLDLLYTVIEQFPSLQEFNMSLQFNPIRQKDKWRTKFEAMRHVKVSILVQNPRIQPPNQISTYNNRIHMLRSVYSI